jgi:hypothetical protein
MKFIGNYSDWLKPEWVEYVLTHDGKEMPKFEFEQNGILDAIARGERAEFCEYQKKYDAAGYKHDSLLYYIFEQDDLPFEITLPPFVKLKEGQGYYWNLFKYKPGHLLPIHSDRAAKFEHNCERYWMSWLDYTDGHVYIYKDSMLSNYKAGDAFKFPDPFGVHGAANISLTPRITFQITTFDIVHD